MSYARGRPYDAAGEDRAIRISANGAAAKCASRRELLTILACGLLLMDTPFAQAPARLPATNPAGTVQPRPGPATFSAQYQSAQNRFSPVIDSITSAAGPVTTAMPGTVLQIHGRNFGAAPQSGQWNSIVGYCYPAQQSCAPKYAFNAATGWSDTLITITVPSIGAGTYSLVIFSSNATAPVPFAQPVPPITFTSNAVSFTVGQLPPAIVNLYGGALATPKGYQAQPGAEIGIGGTNFLDFQGCGPRGRIVIGTLGSTNYRYGHNAAGAETLTLGLPPTIPPGVYSLYLVDGSGRTSNAASLTIAGSASQSFEIIETGPMITAISPNPAWPQPPAYVAISGRGFGAVQGHGEVTLTRASGTVSAIPVTTGLNWSDNAVQFRLPASLPLGTYHVGVYGDPVLACGKASNSMDISLVSGVLTSIAPSAGVVPMLGQQGTSVTVTGGGFGPATTVQFGNDRPITPASIAPDGTSLVAVVPPTAASGPLSVTLPSGTVLTGPNFSVDNYRNTRGFAWKNSPQFQTMIGGSYSFDGDATPLFGSWQTHADVNFPFIGTVNFVGPLVNLFLFIADNALDSNGQCFGMALGSLQLNTGQLSMGSFAQQTLPSPSVDPNGPVGADAWMLNGPGFTGGTNVQPALASFVHQRMLAQFSQESINTFINFHLNVTSAAGLRNILLHAFAAGGHNAGAIVALDPVLGTGHAVVAYGISDTGNGNFDILIYNSDSQFTVSEDSTPSARTPYPSASVIHVTNDGSWTLADSAGMAANIPHNWTGGIDTTITVTPWNAIPLHPSLPWAELIAGVVLTPALLWIVTGDAAVSQVSDAQGHLLLDPRGQLNPDRRTMLTGVRPMPSYGGLGKPLAPAFVSNRPDVLTHTITGGRSGAYRLDWLGGASGVTLANVPTTPGAKDTVKVDVSRVDFSPDRDKALSFTIIGRNTVRAFPRVATLTTRASAGGNVRFFYDAATDTFNYGHTGAPATYTVEFHGLDAQGKAVTFATSPASIDNGATHTFAPNWSQLATRVGTLKVLTPDGRVSSVPMK
ncbi:MAG: IPT/TIG domain-containing protein [Steroidobacteraceae bacterium]